jgi:DNA-binding NarL/FixJ family response regulator
MIAVSIVEDIADIRESLKRLLEASPDFLCLSVYADAETALKGLPEVMPDVVLMDINLPGMSGIDCIKKIKAICPRMLFMMFTIYEDSDQVFDALSAGASGYLLKKTPRDEILPAIKELYEGGSPMSTHIARKVVTYFQNRKEQQAKAAALSPRETDVLELLSKGFLYKEIAERLNLTTGTVRQHIHHIYEKLHVQNRTEAINKFFRM